MPLHGISRWILVLIFIGTYKELSRTHPEDDVRDHENFSQQNSSACDYDERDYCPVVSKAGSR